MHFLLIVLSGCMLYNVAIDKEVFFLVEMPDKKQVIVTARVDNKLRQEFRSLLMKKGVTVQDYIAGHIENYVKTHSATIIASSKEE
jgi:hypothetical protein